MAQVIESAVSTTVEVPETNRVAHVFRHRDVVLFRQGLLSSMTSRCGTVYVKDGSPNTDASTRCVVCKDLLEGDKAVL